MTLIDDTFPSLSSKEDKEKNSQDKLEKNWVGFTNIFLET